MHGSVDAKKSAEDALINNFKIGNTYFVYVDGCWVAVEVDGVHIHGARDLHGRSGLINRKWLAPYRTKSSLGCRPRLNTSLGDEGLVDSICADAQEQNA